MATKPFKPSTIMQALRIQVNEAVKIRLAENVLGSLVLNTPVGQPGTWKSPPPPTYQPGHARFSWSTTTGSAASGDRPGVDPGGAATIARGVSVIQRSKLSDIIYFTNTAPYIGRLNQGWSPQQPPGMIDRAIRGGISSLSSTRITI